ncbi:MAG TPA: DUF2127 domain-containing protein [Candidatus Acidoferrales bacterium]
MPGDQPQSIDAATSRSRKALHGTFECSIVLKGLFALFESIIGATLYFVPRRMLNSIAVTIGTLDLSRNRHDFINVHLRHLLAGITGTGRHFAAAYLISHGLVKLVLVVELLRNRLWAYPLMIAVIGVFVGYQCYRFSLTHSLEMAALTIFDLGVIALTALEYRAQLRIRHESR